MFDLDTLNYLNNRAEREYIPQPKKAKEFSSLEYLAHILRSLRPPSIKVLLSILEDNQNYAEFIKLVKEFLPERERDILKESRIENQIATFASYFEERYFPLPDYYKAGEVESYYELVHALPLIPLGFGYQDYDNLIQDGFPGYRLMTYFIIISIGTADDGARVALGEACQELVPAELLKRMPAPGYTAQELHKLLDGTAYQALAMWGDVVESNTGNEFLDVDEEMMGNSELPDWDRGNVEYFTRKWKEAEKQQEAVGELSNKLENNPAAFLQKILDFIDKRMEVENGGNLNQRARRIPVGSPGSS